MLSDRATILGVVSQERVVRFSVRTVLIAIGLVIAAWALLSTPGDHPPGDLYGFWSRSSWRWR